MREELRPIKKGLILDSLRTGTSISGACSHADISQTTYYDWLKTDEQFAEDVRLAVEAGTDALEDRIHKFSETNWVCALAVLKARRPHKWRENASAVQVNVNQVKPGEDFHATFEKWSARVREAAIDHERAQIEARRNGSIEPQARHGDVVDL